MLNAPAVSGLGIQFEQIFLASFSSLEDLTYAASPNLKSRRALVSTSIEGPIVEEM